MCSIHPSIHPQTQFCVMRKSNTVQAKAQSFRCCYCDVIQIRTESVRYQKAESLVLLISHIISWSNFLSTQIPKCFDIGIIISIELVLFLSQSDQPSPASSSSSSSSGFGRAHKRQGNLSNIGKILLIGESLDLVKPLFLPTEYILLAIYQFILLILMKYE